MSPQRNAAPGNRLLASLSRRNSQKFIASCDHVELEFAAVLSDPGERTTHVYFPLTGFISLVTALDDGERLEVGIVGDEGMLGASLILGIRTSSQHALVQGAGTALRMTAVLFARYCKTDLLLQKQVSGYLHVLMGQLAQMAACTHYHAVEARLARWLLMTRDRAHSDEFRLTHEFLAFMLGVRRVGVTEAASALQERGLISYHRGHIAVIDGAGLVKASCCCYQQALDLYDQTLGSHRASPTRRN